jgi:hypothetical protein
MATGALLHLGRSHRARRPRPAALIALSARLHHRSLDRDLAAGIAGWRSPAHAARATQLTRRRNRQRIAGSLDNVIAIATLPPSALARAAVIPCRASVTATADQIRELSDRLRSDSPVAPAGVIRLRELLCDGAGPVYTPGREEALSAALANAARWLDVGE